MLVFEERGKPEYQEKKSCQHKKKKCWHWKLNLGHIDGRYFSALTTILTKCPFQQSILGPWGEHEEWTEKFRRVITDRLGIATGGLVSMDNNEGIHPGKVI